MNETCGKYSLSLLCLNSLSTHNTFQGLKCQQAVKKTAMCFRTNVCAHVYVHVYVQVLVLAT